MKNVEQIVRVFRSKGFKITPQRLAIFEILQGNTSHPSAERIYSQLRESHPSISFTTVYNTLETLRDIGEIQELTIDSRRKHYDPDISRHHHVLCTKCGHIEDVFVDYSSYLRLPEEVRARFKVQNHQVQFYGICSNCQSQTSH